MSYTLPEVSSTGGDVSVYQLKWVEWKGGFSPVVVQNENGPCPLLALCNVLILSGRIKIPAGETVVTSTHLLDLLGAYLMESHSGVRLTAGERANYEQNIQDAMAVFPNLQTGLDVNVKFTSVSGFEFTSESGLFDLFDVALYHGWLVDPQDEAAYQVVSHCSYNQLVEMVVNNSNSDDINKVKNDHVWETLEDIDGGGNFLDAHFRWTSHSESQQRREKASKDAKDIVIEDSKDTPVDEQNLSGLNMGVQTKLGLQQEEHRDIAGDVQSQASPTQVGQEIADAELAAQLFVDELNLNSSTSPTKPPSSLEEYQRAAELDQSVKNKLCCVM